MRAWWRSLLAVKTSAQPEAGEVNRLRDGYARLDDSALHEAGQAGGKPERGRGRYLRRRLPGDRAADVRLCSSKAPWRLRTARSSKCRPAKARRWRRFPPWCGTRESGLGVHVLTANDYLAKRDAAWMGGIYNRLGLSVASIHQDMTPEARQAAYRCDVTYATANEVGFDYLRDQLALDPQEQVLRPFAAAVIDEADSILIDDARIPLVIAGGTVEPSEHAVRADPVVRRLIPHIHFTLEQSSCQLVPPLRQAGVRAHAVGLARGDRAGGPAAPRAARPAVGTATARAATTGRLRSLDAVEVQRFQPRPREAAVPHLGETLLALARRLVVLAPFRAPPGR